MKWFALLLPLICEAVRLADSSSALFQPWFVHVCASGFVKAVVQMGLPEGSVACARRRPDFVQTWPEPAQAPTNFTLVELTAYNVPGFPAQRSAGEAATLGRFEGVSHLPFAKQKAKPPKAEVEFPPKQPRVDWLIIRRTFTFEPGLGLDCTWASWKAPTPAFVTPMYQSAREDQVEVGGYCAPGHVQHCSHPTDDRQTLKQWGGQQEGSCRQPKDLPTCWSMHTFLRNMSGLCFMRSKVNRTLPVAFLQHFSRRRVVARCFLSRQVQILQGISDPPGSQRG